MSKTRKNILFLFTIFPISYILYQIFLVIYFQIRMYNDVNYLFSDYSGDYTISIIYGFIALIDFIIIATIYLIHNIINTRIDGRIKFFRTLLIIVGNIIGIQIYWNRYIHKEL
jgi:uncharacterized membrane protein